jgi:CDP-diacylglycerol--glycerol-3-phosphate 3-phosphatidyltransferase
MFTAWLRRVFGGLVNAGARGLARLGVHPNVLTIAGCLLQLGVGVVVATGNLRVGGVLLLVTALSDAFDGALARLQGRQTKFGAFLDSTLDRIAEAGVYLGLAWYYLGQPGMVEELLVYLAITGSILVSYTRARAEGLGLSPKEGLFTRVERTLVLTLALVIGWTGPALWVLAVGTWATAIHRMVSVFLQLRDTPLDA